MANELTQILQRIDQLEKRLIAQSSLGLSDGDRKYISIGVNGSCLWSLCNETMTPLEASQITGYLQKVEIKRDGEKLHFFLECGAYIAVLVTGSSTHFARTLLASIVCLKGNQIYEPVTIRPDRGDPEKAQAGRNPVFCNLSIKDELVRSNSVSKEPVNQLLTMVMSKLPGNIDADMQEEDEQLYQYASESTQQGSASYTSPSHPASQVSHQGDHTLSANNAFANIDWSAVCDALGISENQRRAVAQNMKLPFGELNANQNSQLYSALYQKFGAK